MSASKVSVIIPHYSEDKTFLNLCLKSLMRQTHENLEIIVSSSSPITPTGLHPKIRLYQSQERMHYTKAINKGVAIALEASPLPEFLVLGNDDTIYSEGAIEAMVKMCANHDLILNAFSNCDNGFSHHSGLALYNEENKCLPLKAQIELSEVYGFEEQIMSIPNGYFGTPIYIEPRSGFVCFYGTMIPVKTWLKVGTLDEQFVSAGQDDSDYCFRAAKMKIPALWTPFAFIFHFGGKTSNIHTTQEERDSNQEKFNKKWNIV